MQADKSSQNTVLIIVGSTDDASVLTINVIHAQFTIENEKGLKQLEEHVDNNKVYISTSNMLTLAYTNISLACILTSI